MAYDKGTATRRMVREAIRQLTVLFASRKVNLLNASIEKVTEAITSGHLGMIESTPTGNETLEIRVCIFRRQPDSKNKGLIYMTPSERNEA